jgi:glycosyltransferase involved in cell wall biosynthesis
MTNEVLHFTDSDGFGGAEKAMLTLMAGLDRRRWRSSLAYHASPGIAPLVERARSLGVSTWAVSPMPHGLAGIARIPAFALALRRRSPAVFHAHLVWPLAAKNALAAAVLARRPAVVATAQLYLDVDVDRLMRLQQRAIASGIGRYLVVSRHTGDRFHASVGWPLEKIEVIPNAVDVAALRRPRSPELRQTLQGNGELPLVLVVARLDPQKGHRDLLAAAASVPDARFLLAGDGFERPALERLAHELGVSDRVSFLGHRDDIADLLAASDVFVLPSLYEGLPISVLEAMAAGIPVIATRVGGTDEAVVHGESGLLVRRSDPSELGAAIRRVLSDRELRLRLVAGGTARVERHFTAAVNVQRTMETYESLTRQRSGRRVTE